MRKEKDIVAVSDTEFDAVVAEVVRGICTYYEVDKGVLYSSTREMQCVECRWMAWVFIRLYLPNCPLKKMANEFGLSDHTTVMNGLRQMRYWIRVSKPYTDAYAALRGIISVDLSKMARHELDYGVAEWRRRALMLENELKQYKN